jgi:TolA-binding protein
MSRSLKEWRLCLLGVMLSVAPCIAYAQDGASGDAARRTAETPADAPTKKLLAAHGLFQRGLFKLASQEYADFLSEYPTHPQRTAAMYAQALCQYRQNDFDRAATLLAGVLKDSAFEQRAEALAVLGHCELSRKQYDRAIAALDELLAKFPKSPQAEPGALNRAQALYLSTKYKEAAAACDAFAHDYPKSAQRPAALYFQALSQRAAGQHAQAVATADQLLQESPQSRYTPDALLVAGQSLEAQGKLDDAADHYRKMLATAPPERKGDAHYSLGAALYKAGKFDESITALAKVEDGPYAKPARLQLGLAQLAANRLPEARATLAAAARADDNPASIAAARYGLARCDMAEKKFASARKILGDLLAAKSANAGQLSLDRAICLMELGKFEDAAGEFAQLAANGVTSPQTAEALYRQAFCLHKLSKFDKSHEICDGATKARPTEFAAALAELDAENLFALAKYPDAAAAFDALARGTKDDHRA